MALTRSGQITVTTAGTAVQGPATPQGRLFALRAHPDNTNDVWVGNDGADDVTASNGFPLSATADLLVEVSSLRGLWFDADTNGEKVCWFMVL